MSAQTEVLPDLLESLDIRPACENHGRCTEAAAWVGRGNCPHCGCGVFLIGPVIMLCEQHAARTRAFMRLATTITCDLRCLACRAPVVVDPSTWRRL